MELHKINIERDVEVCIAARKDAYLCSFGTLEGVEKILSGYRERVMARLSDPRFYYYHLWDNSQMVGQLEFRSYWKSDMNEQFGWNTHETGYLYLIYLTPEARGSGLAHDLHDVITTTLTRCGCKRIILSASTTNERAMRFYTKKGWHYLGRNTKHSTTDYLRFDLMR